MQVADVSTPVFRRLNMTHGIMRSIVRHQIESSEFDKLETKRRVRVRRSMDELGSPRKSNGSEADVFEAESPLSPGSPAIPTSEPATPNSEPELNTSDQSSATEDSLNNLPKSFDTPEFERMRRRISGRLESQMKNSESDLIESMAALRVNSLATQPVIEQVRKPIFRLKITINEKLSVFEIYKDDSAARKAKEIARELRLGDKKCCYLRKQIEKSLEHLKIK